jgi:formamidopyrimidine-DNA glycosylase
MDQELRGKKIVSVEVLQVKILNRPVKEFEDLVVGRKIGPVTSRGKWVFVKLEPGSKAGSGGKPGPETHFLLSLGMGGEVLLRKPGEAPPAKYRLKFTFGDRSYLTINFWWFGYAHAVTADELASHKMTADLGLDPMDDGEFTFGRFRDLLTGRKGAIKAVLMDQRKIAGIGNVYIQEILLRARLHPDRKIPSLTAAELKRLYEATVGALREAVDDGGLKYEVDLHNEHGRYDPAWHPGGPCPKCGTTMEKVKTGGTMQIVCPKCQVKQG